MRLLPLRQIAQWTVALAAITACATLHRAGETDNQPRTQNSAASSASDTTPFATSRADYSRYTEPGECERTVWHVRARIWRHGERDTLPYDPLHDTLPTAAVIAGRSCAAHFTVNGTEPRELFFLMRLSLAIGNDTQARAALSRHLTFAHDTAERGRILLNAVHAYLDAKPMRLDTAIAFVAQLDSLGTAAQISRVQAHNALLTYWSNTFNIEQIKREALRVIALSSTLSRGDQEKIVGTLQSPYLRLATVAAFENGPLAAVPILGQGSVRLSSLREGSVGQLFQNVMQSYQIQAGIYGHPAPQLTGDYWFNHDTTTPRPTPGKVSLFLRVSQNCGDYCYVQYALVHRLFQQYANAGLEFTFMAKTQGYSPNTLPQPANEEIDSIADFFMHEIKLPGALVIDTTRYTYQPDGRRINQPVSFEIAYHNAPVVLIDRSGIIQWMGNFGVANEALLNAYIKRLLQ